MGRLHHGGSRRRRAQGRKPPVIETARLEEPKAGEVSVEIKAAGIRHTDAFTFSGGDPEGLLPAIRAGDMPKERRACPAHQQVTGR